MNEQPGSDQMIGDAELRMALRGMRRDAVPAHDLWPGIAARIQATPQAALSHARPARQWLWSLAAAASLMLAVGVAWQGRPLDNTRAGPSAAAPAIARATLVQREADSMTVQYRAALRELDPHAVPATWRPGLDALDRSAAEIRGALQHDPDSRLLLERLRDTYTRRLALARRALYA